MRVQSNSSDSPSNTRTRTRSGIIHFEQSGSSPPDRSSADDAGAAMPKVIGPFVTSRIEEPDHPLSNRIDAGHVWSFCQVAFRARKGEIFGGLATAMLSRPNMFHMKSQFGKSLWQMAVFAAITRPAANQFAQSQIH